MHPLKLITKFHLTGFLANVYFCTIFEAFLCHLLGNESCHFWSRVYLNQIILRGGVSVPLVLARHWMP